jgi:hypothetical protein
MKVLIQYNKNKTEKYFLGILEIACKASKRGVSLFMKSGEVTHCLSVHRVREYQKLLTFAGFCQQIQSLPYPPFRFVFVFLATLEKANTQEVYSGIREFKNIIIHDAVFARASRARIPQMRIAARGRMR